MNMKDHILTALREQFHSWEEMPASLSEQQITAPQFDLDWSIRDVIAHLWGWQQISSARMEAGTLDREPEFPKWVMELHGVWEESADETNARICEINHEKPWTEIHQNWRTGFLRFLELGSKISERDLLDGDKYLWLKGYSLAFILIASYDHHQEHLEELIVWLQEHGN
ncbi:MAG TPA: ClbS/DfsB family four-helix bundle protein [Anaerolineales bacterium]|nr:ClbS/DfsB family four-helix bundle protein [Anaerolineales bacterium]